MTGTNGEREVYQLAVGAVGHWRHYTVAAVSIGTGDSSTAASGTATAAATAAASCTSGTGRKRCAEAL